MGSTLQSKRRAAVTNNKGRAVNTELHYNHCTQDEGRRISRVDFLKRLGLLAGVALAGCSPFKALFKAYPRRFDDDATLIDNMLRAFVVTVIPGAPIDDEHLVRIYADRYYPFYQHSGFFVSQLAQRSKDLFGSERFDCLTLEQRTRVVQDGLQADVTVGRLFRAAIFMAQISFYAGIYNDEGGCPLIDFEGSNNGFTPDEMCYANNRTYLVRELTSNGNYA
jgi:hypothetical protein